MEHDVLDLAGSLGFLDELDATYRRDPRAIDPSWYALLDGRPAPAPAPAAAPPPRPRGNGAALARRAVEALPDAAVWPLVNAYRSRGHFAADLDPLDLLETARVAELDPATWGLADDGRVIADTGVHGLGPTTIGQLVAQLRRACDVMWTNSRPTGPQ
jgi:2-oxoglutarate dehydrogenase E1 component